MKSITRQLREEIINLFQAQDHFGKALEGIVESLGCEKTPHNQEARILLLRLYDLQDIVKIQAGEFSEYSKKTIRAARELGLKQADEVADEILEELARHAGRNNRAKTTLDSPVNMQTE